MLGRHRIRWANNNAALVFYLVFDEGVVVSTTACQAEAECRSRLRYCASKQESSDIKFLIKLIAERLTQMSGM